MGTRRLETLGDAMRAGIAFVVVSCRRCGREAKFVVAELIPFFGAGRQVRALPFACRECKVRDVAFGLERRPDLPASPSVPRPVPKG